MKVKSPTFYIFNQIFKGFTIVHFTKIVDDSTIKMSC